MESALETGASPKVPSRESIPHPINQLPQDVFILIPRFFAREKGDHNQFPMNKPLITMTHVCRSWRNALLSTPSLWTQIDFSTFESKQAEGFVARSENQLLDVYQSVDEADHIEPFLPITLHNTYRLRWLKVACHYEHIEDILGRLTKPAPELKHLEIANDPREKEDDTFTVGDAELPSTIFGGQFPKLTTFSLRSICTDLRDLDLPSLTRFTFKTATSVSTLDLTSFFRRCPSLEFIQVYFYGRRISPINPPKNRVCLVALKELRLGSVPCAAGLIDHLTLPLCTEVVLEGEFTGVEFDNYGGPIARIHPSSIDHLPVTTGITKAVAMPSSCILSGPNGILRFRCSNARASLDAEFFTWFTPISVLEIRELWVAQKAADRFGSIRCWNPSVAGIYSAFGTLMKVEDLTIVSSRMTPFYSALAAVADNHVPLPKLRRLTVFLGQRNLNVSAFIQCAKTRKEHSQPFGDVTIVFEEQADFVKEVELLREFVGELTCRVGAAPKLSCVVEDCEA